MVLARPLREALAAKKNAIADGWLARTLETYPERTRHFLGQETDPFRNPVGHTLKEAFPALVDQLLGAMDAARIRDLLDGVVRVRAVQDFTAAQAVAFVFLLRKILREALDRPSHPSLSLRGGEDKGEEPMDLVAVDARIDEMALTAFDLFMKCREQMHEIRANEAKRRTSLLERMRERP